LRAVARTATATVPDGPEATARLSGGPGATAAPVGGTGVEIREFPQIVANPALDAGLDVDPAAADVASVLAAGFRRGPAACCTS
jgi:hypothetical protein